MAPKKSRNTSLSNALRILDKYKRFTWPEIQKYLRESSFPLAFRTPAKYNKLSQFHWKIIREYPKRKGKYLRPTLLLLTSEAMGAPRTKALKTAAAMQISEEWLLIHDDFEDNSLMRRGKPTLHRMYGSELAVNAGDALNVIMWKVLMDNVRILGKEKTVALADEFYRIVARTALGQTAEIKLTKDRKPYFSDQDWFFIADGKTSYYTIAGPMRLGAIIADGTKTQLNTLAKFGIYLGRCFQLVDDTLDLTSDFAGLKKQTGNDVYEGKRTVILGHLLRNVNQKDKKMLLSILKKPRDKKTKDEVSWIIARMHQYGSISHARQLAKKFKEKAYGIFENELTFLSKQPQRKQLETLIHFVLEREY